MKILQLQKYLIEKYRSEIPIFLFAFVWQGGHWLSFFPAIYSWDIFYYFESIFAKGSWPGRINRESFLYELYVYCFSALDSSLFAATFFQIILYCILVARIFVLIKEVSRSEKLAALTVLIVLVLPPNIYLTLLTERDNLFVFFGCFGLIELAQFYLNKEKTNDTVSFFKALICFSVMAALRKESMTILLTLPIYYFYGRGFKAKLKTLVSTSAIIVTIVFYSFSTNLLSKQKAFGIENSYNFIAFRNSFLYISSVNYDQLTPRNLELLGYFIDVKELKNSDKMLVLGVSGVKWNPHPEIIKELYDLVIRTILENPLLFIQARWLIFKNTNFGSMFNSPLLIDPNERFKFAQDFKVVKMFDFKTRNLFPKEIGLFQEFFNSASTFGTFLFSISSPFYFVWSILILLFFVFWIPKISILASIPFQHILIVFLFSPGSSTKYYYFAYMASTILVPLAISEVIKKVTFKISEKNNRSIES